ncbi:MAG: GAF domain-containing sensor histidine kinase [Chloroflexi bacterium]|nr:GAF domain-containing sensor histidine kinase [Chloroflexota bacterium]
MRQATGQHPPRPGSSVERLRAAELAPPSAGAVLRAVTDLLLTAGELTSPPDLALALAQSAAALTGADQASVGEIQGGDVATLAAHHVRRETAGTRFPVGYGVAGWVAATGQPATIADVRHDRRYVDVAYPEVRSFVAVPLRRGAATVGVLSLAAFRASAFPPGLADALLPLGEVGAYLLSRPAAATAPPSALALAEAAHELKAPLTALTGYVRLLLEERTGPLTPLQREFLSIAAEQGTRLEEAVLALVEHGARDVPYLVGADRRTGENGDSERHTARDLLEAAVRLARPSAEARQVELRVQVAPDAPSVAAPREAVLQVLANLLSNALRAAPGRSHVLVAAARVNASNQVVFVVADRGKGFGSIDPARLFAPFVQDLPPESRAERGSVGLGLAIARRVVEAHGGRIWAEARADGPGARVCFTLPACAPPEEPQPRRGATVRTIGRISPER